MQWHTVYGAENYVKDRQNELRALANAAHREVAAEKRRKKTNRFQLSNLFKREHVDIRTTGDNLSPVSDAR